MEKEQKQGNMEETSLKNTLKRVRGYMQQDLDATKIIEGGGPVYRYTIEDVKDELKSYDSDEPDTESFRSARDIAPLFRKNPKVKK